MLRLFLPGEISVCKTDFLRSNHISTYKIPLFVSEQSVIKKISYHSKEITQGLYNIQFLLSTDNGLVYNSLLSVDIGSGVCERVFVPSIVIPEKSLLRVVYTKNTARVSDIQLSFKVEPLCVT